MNGWKIDHKLTPNRRKIVQNRAQIDTKSYLGVVLGSSGTLGALRCEKVISGTPLPVTAASQQGHFGANLALNFQNCHFVSDFR